MSYEPPRKKVKMVPMYIDNNMKRHEIVTNENNKLCENLVQCGTCSAVKCRRNHPYNLWKQ
jgi:hypothetical protein